MKKRFLSTFMVLVMCFTLLPTKIVTMANVWWGGEGTEQNPYQIKTAEDLKVLAEHVNAGYACENEYFKLMNDINLSSFNSKQYFDFLLPKNFKYEMRKEIIEFSTSNDTLFYSNTIEYPYFFDKSLVEQKINQRYEQMILDYKNAQIDVDTEYCDIDQLPFYDDVKANVIYNKNGAISIKEILSVWSGGAHAYHYINGITYDNLTGKELSYNDILVGSDEQIDKVLTIALCKALGYMPCKSQLNDLKEYTTYSLCEYGLCFYYNVGDAIPRKEVIIPFTDKDNYIISADKVCIDI